MSRKKILFAINNMNVGGTEKSLINLLALLPPELYDITVLMLEKKGGYISDLPKHIAVEAVDEGNRIKTITDIPLPLQILNALKKKQIPYAISLAFLYARIRFSNNWNLLNQYALKGYRNNKQYDIAIAYAGPYFVLSELILNKIKARKKYQWIHFDVSKLNLDIKLGCRLFSGFDQIFCVSDSARISFNGNFPEQASKTVTFENVIHRKTVAELAGNTDPYPNKAKSDYLRILTVGRLSAEKGQDIIPEVCYLLTKSSKDFQWYLVGDGDLKNDIITNAVKFGVEDKITFLGTQHNPYPYFKFCDLYVQTSHQEGYGITIAEAKLFNKPVVTTEVASARDLITNNVSGLIVGFESQDIYKGIMNIIENPSLVQAIVKTLEMESANDAVPLIKKYF